MRVRLSPVYKTYISMELVERMKHVESVHINDGCVDCQLAPIRPR